MHHPVRVTEGKGLCTLQCAVALVGKQRR